MKIFVVVKPNARHDSIKKIDATHYVAFVTKPPREGKANKALINAFAHELSISKSKVKILAGAKSKQKVLEVL